jgi:hypothetical protein
MLIEQNLDLTKYKRFFAFGCSFTKYKWPTWADVLGSHIPVYENWAEHASGNQFIFNSIIECNRRNKFSKDDLIGIMWTSCVREDRYVKDRWVFASSDQRKNVYGSEWMNRFGIHEEGNLIRDLASIDSIQYVLTSLGVDWLNLNSIPLIRFDYNKVYKDISDKKITIEQVETRWNEVQRKLSGGEHINEDYILAPEVIDLYRDLFKKIKYPLLEKITDNREDKHPTLTEAIKYLKDTINIELDLKNLDHKIIPKRF